jgi:hypothetical protein
MKNINRYLIPLAVLLFGTALIPFVEIPTATFSWQRYINAYQDPLLTINYFDGSPGSHFTITGNKFTPDEMATVSVNGLVLGTLPADGAGSFQFRINSGAAEPGYYEVEVSTGVPADQVGFTLSLTAPLRPLEDSGMIFDLPSGIAAQRAYMPIIPK